MLSDSFAKVNNFKRYGFNYYFTTKINITNKTLMFTPQKQNHVVKLTSFSHSFQSSLRKYQSSNKKHTFHKDIQPLPQIFLPISNQERLRRYTRVREQQMARSRSRVRQLVQNKQKTKQSLFSITKFITIPSLIQQFDFPIQFCKDQAKLTLLDAKNNTQMKEDQNLRLHKKGINSCQQIQQITNQNTTPGLQLLQQTLLDAFSNISIQGFSPQVKNQNMVRFNQETNNLEEQESELVDSNQQKYQTVCYQENIPDSIDDYLDSTNNNKNCEFLGQKNFQAEYSGSCILIKGGSVNYRISLRQLNKLWKKINDFDSLVHLIANKRPHLMPLKSVIAESLYKYLF